MISSLSKNEKPIRSGRDIARYFIYFSKFKTATIKNINIVNISGIGLYRKYSEILDRSYAVLDKYEIDAVKFVKYFVDKFGTNEANIEKLKEVYPYTWYAEDLQIKAKYQKVYDSLMKSVDNVVNECVKGNYSSATEYLRYLIENNKLAGKYISGELSQYYLAGIKNLRKLVSKMDTINRDTLMEIVENQDKIVSDMQDAFTYFRRSRISIISYTNDKLFKQLGI